MRQVVEHVFKSIGTGCQTWIEPAAGTGPSRSQIQALKRCPLLKPVYKCVFKCLLVAVYGALRIGSVANIGQRCSRLCNLNLI